MRQLWRVLVAVIALEISTPSSEAAAEIKLATFRADVTPPLGNAGCVGFMPKIESIEHPLELRGVVLVTSRGTFVLAAIDYCGVCNSSHDKLRDAIASAAGTTRERVALQSLHQHSAPALDEDSSRWLHGERSAEYLAHRAVVDDIASRAAKAVTDGRNRLMRVTRVVATRAKVDRVASNRRVPLADGSIGVRASITRDAAIREADEGLIDPWLRTLTFSDGDKPIAQLHYYATHPQTFYGDARISWDTVGMARERCEAATKIFQVYFTGCGGNVTVGKYNDGDRASREQLTGRLLEAMLKSSQEPVGTEATKAIVEQDIDAAVLKNEDVDWATTPIKFTPREDGAFHPETLRKQLALELPFSTRLTAACFLAFRQRLLDGHVGEASRLRIGSINVVHLPGEPFVEFQLFAQQSAKDASVCVAGYGDCGVWYFGPDRIYSDRGGYEQTWSLTGSCQDTVEGSLKRLLTLKK
ncbi:MAG: hypothetical protein NT013_07555 [Planctomycetia bacterium]|nr:hypothetical protein [Planctomycetia bacterium]